MTDKIGPLIIIGGHEDKEDKRAILKAIAAEVQGRKLIIATIASHEPEGYFTTYQKAFADLGVGELVELYIHDRAESHDVQVADAFNDAGGIFFTGGDQLRISSQIGDTPIETMVRDLHDRGGLVAGTSAGAAAMSEIMLVKGSSRETHRIGDLHMAPGLGFVEGAIIDQHFAERGRIGRLLGAVAQNPRVIGIGIDENTAIVVRDRMFQVIGVGAVYVVDAAHVTQSNIAKAHPDRTLSMHGVHLHVLSAGDHFDIDSRTPSQRPSDAQPERSDHEHAAARPRA
ncbi:MAG: cyanophycinase [Sphingopyxis sp.]|nr:cyanophycinase [Sphingopyxis sp.]